MGCMWKTQTQWHWDESFLWANHCTSLSKPPTWDENIANIMQLRFHKVGRPILTYWTKKSPNALFLSWFPVSAHLLKGNANSRDKIRWTSGLCTSPTFLCFHVEMSPHFEPGRWFCHFGLLSAPTIQSHRVPQSHREPLDGRWNK